MRMSKLRHSWTASVVFIMIIVDCTCETVPEDLLTDNDEQLYKLQRDDLIDSILEKITPRSSEQSDEGIESNELPHEKLDKEKSPPLQLKSMLPSPSRFSSSYQNTVTIHTSTNASTSAINTGLLITNKTTFQPMSSTQRLQESFLAKQSQAIQSIEVNSSSFTGIASTTSYPSSVSAINVTLSLGNSPILVSTMITSTTSFRLSSALMPYSISMVHDTAQSTLQPTSTVFAVGQPTQSSSISETPKILTVQKSVSSIANIPTSSISPETSTRKMPEIPDERQFGVFIPTTIKNEEGISFIYINVLLPIVAGITGALFITFSILLFRCCRRRKLKKVRYFGAKKRDNASGSNELTDRYK